MGGPGSDIDAFFARHAAAAAYLAQAQRELQAGTGAAEVSVVANRDELLQTYRIRAKHLARYASEHAQRLRAEVRALLVALDDSDEDAVRIWCFACADGVAVVAFESETDRALLGCLKSYSKLRVTPERWREIWGLRDPLRWS